MATGQTDQVASDLLRRAHSPDVADTILRERVKQRPLLLRPTSPDPALDARSKRQHERLRKQRARRKSTKPRPLSAKQKRSLCLYDVPKEQRKYAIYQPLHRMWCGYMSEILGLASNKRRSVDAQSSGQTLVSADYHGALVEVVRSRCVGRVGLKGIVVKDTKFTFEIVTSKDDLKTIPKEHTLFRFEIPNTEDGMGDDQPPARALTFEIHGGQFANRAPDRANKKFRWHFDPDL